MDNELKNALETYDIEKNIQSKIDDAIKTIVNRIDHNIRTSAHNFVKPLSDNICLINLSQLENNNLAPDYYIPSSQARYVKEYLEKSNSTVKLFEKIQNMVESGYVQGNSRKFKLNTHTISILSMFLKENNIIV